MSTLIADLHQALAEMPPAERLKALDLLPRTIDAAMVATVAELRAAGASWADIGSALGVTRQTAHERFASRL